MAEHTTFGRIATLAVLGLGLSNPAAFAAAEGSDSGSSLSEQEHQAMEIAFNEFDEDKDNSLNWENEVLPAHIGWFSDFDVDGNQEIVSEEFIVMHLHMKPDMTLDKQLAVVQQATDRFKVLDLDSNEQIPRDEYIKAYQQAFDKADENGDKQLTKDELRQYLAEQSAEDPRTPPLNEIDQVLPSPRAQSGQADSDQGDRSGSSQGGQTGQEGDSQTQQSGGNQGQKSDQ